MRARTLAAAYMVIVGISMLGLWAMLYLTDSIPELRNQPAFITAHIVAEDAMRLFFLAMGMLVYTLVMSLLHGHRRLGVRVVVRRHVGHRGDLPRLGDLEAWYLQPRIDGAGAFALV